MIRASLKKFIILLLSIVLILTSCTVTEKITINGSQKGSSSSDIYVEDFFIEVLEDFGEFLPSSDKSIMDEAMEGFAGQLQSSSAASVVKFKNLGDNHYTLDFSFTDMNKMMKDLGAANNTLIKETANSCAAHGWSTILGVIVEHEPAGTVQSRECLGCTAFGNL